LSVLGQKNTDSDTPAAKLRWPIERKCSRKRYGMKDESCPGVEWRCWKCKWLGGSIESM